MNKLSNFLWKLFSITMVLSWNAKDVALAADTTEQEDTNWGIYSRGKSGTSKTICPAGQYVYACGPYKVGYNWLKSVTFTAPNGTSRTTKNYNIGEDNYDKMEQLRALFNTSQLIKYQDDSSVIRIDSSNKIVRDDRDFVLGLLCNPLDPTITISCAACPDGGTVKSSDVKIGNDTNYEETDLLLIRNSWHFNTIADCYVSEFEDASGSFIYVPSTVQNIDTLKAECYYTNTSASANNFIAGDNIGNFVYGGNVSNVQSVEIEIPE